MRHQKPYRKLSRHRSHYTSLMRNLAHALFQKERIRTTLTKAKECRGFIDQIITLGKDGTLHARRRAFALMGNKVESIANGKKLNSIDKVFAEFSKRYAGRKGGYTRIIKLTPRPGDCAPMAFLELIDANLKVVKGDKDSKATTAASEKTTAEKKPAKEKAAKKSKAA